MEVHRMKVFVFPLDVFLLAFKTTSYTNRNGIFFFFFFFFFLVSFYFCQLITCVIRSLCVTKIGGRSLFAFFVFNFF